MYVVELEDKKMTCNCTYFKKSFRTFCKHIIKVVITYSKDFSLSN